MISPKNMPPVAADSERAIELAAMRVRDKSHSFIFDEIYHRSFIEYVPNQVIDGVEVEEQVNGVEAVISDESSDIEYVSDSDSDSYVDDDDDAKKYTVITPNYNNSLTYKYMKLTFYESSPLCLIVVLYL